MTHNGSGHTKGGRAHSDGTRSVQPLGPLSPDGGRHPDFSKEVFQQPQKFSAETSRYCEKRHDRIVVPSM